MECVNAISKVSAMSCSEFSTYNSLLSRIVNIRSHILTVLLPLVPSFWSVYIWYLQLFKFVVESGGIISLARCPRRQWQPIRQAVQVLLPTTRGLEPLRRSTELTPLPEVILVSVEGSRMTYIKEKILLGINSLHFPIMQKSHHLVNFLLNS